MKQSLSYYIVLLVLKLKGVKKKFSQDPIDYVKVRKDDIHTPTNKPFQNCNSFNILNSKITEINEGSGKLILFIPGGAFISGPVQHHWDSMQNIAKETNQCIWMCDYPKAPENDILKMSNNIDSIYNFAIKRYNADDITIIGDSVGGTLATCLIQRLNEKHISLPSKIILLSPVMDASMDNPKIKDIEIKDPMLSKKGVLSAKKMCANKVDLKERIISPLYGSFHNFPATYLFLAHNDIMFPDEKIMVEKLKEAKVKFHVTEGENMPHIWPLLPVMKEAKIALNEVIRIIKK